MAGRAWRHRMDAAAALSVRKGMRRRRGAQPDRAGLETAGPGAVDLWHRRAEVHLPAAHSFRRGLLVPGLLGAGRGLRPRQPEDSRGAPGRHLCGQRLEDLDHACAPRQSHVHAGAHQFRGKEAGGHLIPADRFVFSRHRGAPDPDQRGRSRGQPGFPGRRRRSRGKPGGRGRAGLDDRQVPSRKRTGRIMSRAEARL